MGGRKGRGKQKGKWKRGGGGTGGRYDDRGRRMSWSDESGQDLVSFLDENSRNESRGSFSDNDGDGKPKSALKRSGSVLGSGKGGGGMGMGMGMGMGGEGGNHDLNNIGGIQVRARVGAKRQKKQRIT